MNDDGAGRALVERAQNGDREALEGVVVSIRGRVHALALRMLWNPEDANDATQEILVRIVTRLATFRGESSFTTWVYRVAANHLLTVRKSRLEEQRYTFDRFGGELDEGLTDETQADGAARDLLLQEVRVGCTLGMLQCLDRPHRLAYILGEILELEGGEAARVLEIGAATFRKRLSRRPRGGDRIHPCQVRPRRAHARVPLPEAPAGRASARPRRAGSSALRREPRERVELPGRPRGDPAAG